jgi:hypothetical protein
VFGFETPSRTGVGKRRPFNNVSQVYNYTDWSAAGKLSIKGEFMTAKGMQRLTKVTYLFEFQFLKLRIKRKTALCSLFYPCN